MTCSLLSSFCLQMLHFHPISGHGNSPNNQVRTIWSFGQENVRLYLGKWSSHRCSSYCHQFFNFFPSWCWILRSRMCKSCTLTHFPSILSPSKGKEHISFRALHFGDTTYNKNITSLTSLSSIILVVVKTEGCLCTWLWHPYKCDASCGSQKYQIEFLEHRFIHCLVVLWYTLDEVFIDAHASIQSICGSYAFQLLC